MSSAHRSCSAGTAGSIVVGVLGLVITPLVINDPRVPSIGLPAWIADGIGLLAGGLVMR